MQVGGNHYETMKVQPWDAMEASSNLDELKGYHINTVIGYLMCRHGKGGDEDIRKAAHHMQRLIQIMDDAAEGKKEGKADLWSRIMDKLADEMAEESPEIIAEVVVDMAKMLSKLTGADVQVRAVRRASSKGA